MMKGSWIIEHIYNIGLVANIQLAYRKCGKFHLNGF